MRLNTNSVARPQPATPDLGSAHRVDDPGLSLSEIRFKEQAIFLAIWRLNPLRRSGVPSASLVKELFALMQSAARNFEDEERCLRLLRPAEYQAQRAAHHRILQDLASLRMSLLDGARIEPFDFDQALNEFLFHCVCNDPWVGLPRQHFGHFARPPKSYS